MGDCRKHVKPVLHPEASLPLMRIQQAMSRFKCIESDCEDSCCHSWPVLIDDGGAARLKSACQKGGLDDLSFEEIVEMAPQKAGCNVMKKKDDSRRCMLWDGDGLCRIQKNLGADYQPDGCRTYPRVMQRVFGVHELHGKISCPEMARKTLLVDDGADWVETETAIPRFFLLSRVDQSSDFPYGNAINGIRQLLLKLLAPEPRSGFRRMNHFCMESRRFFDREIDRFPTRDIRSLYQQCLKSPTVADVDMPYMVILLRRLFAFFEAGKTHPTTRIYFQKHAERSGLNLDSEQSVFERFLSGMMAMEDRLMVTHREQQKRWLTNFARHYVMSRSYVEDRDLSVYVNRLWMRLYFCRIMLALHPDMQRYASGGDLSSDAFDAAVIQAVSKSSRILEHSDEFTQWWSPSAQMQHVQVCYSLSVVGQSPS